MDVDVESVWRLHMSRNLDQKRYEWRIRLEPLDSPFMWG